MHAPLKAIARAATLSFLAVASILCAAAQPAASAPSQPVVQAGAVEPDHGAEARATRAYDEAMREGPLAV